MGIIGLLACAVVCAREAMRLRSGGVKRPIWGGCGGMALAMDGQTDVQIFMRFIWNSSVYKERSSRCHNGQITA